MLSNFYIRVEYPVVYVVLVDRQLYSRNLISLCLIFATTTMQFQLTSLALIAFMAAFVQAGPVQALARQDNPQPAPCTPGKINIQLYCRRDFFLEIIANNY